MKEDITFSDVVQEVRDAYSEKVSETPKGGKGDLFKNIVNEKFIKYGEIFGFGSTHSFKSAISRSIRALKNGEPLFSLEPPLIFNKTYPPPSEGDGRAFTEFQIASLSLNGDSY